MPQPFKLCYITDRQTLRNGSLPAFLREAAGAGVNMIQVREKDLGTQALIKLVAGAVSCAQGTRTQVVVNDRLDVASTTRAAGVHLGRHSLPAARARAMVPKEFLIGVSCHSMPDVLDAESSGADYVFLGPIYETPSKLAYGSPLGLGVLREAAARAAIPVYALGGITVERATYCLGAGAAGIAGIRLFQHAPSLANRVAELRGGFGADS